MDGDIRGWDITGEDVESFETEKPVECLAIVASEPHIDETTRMPYVFVLIRGVMRMMKELGQRGVVITKIFATSETPTGIAMAMHAGMKEIEPRIGKRIRFELDTKESQSFLIKSYREGLAEWKRRQGNYPPPVSQP